MTTADRITKVFMLLPERHCEPNSHEHESRPFILWAEAGQNVIPDLQSEQENIRFDTGSSVRKQHKDRLGGYCAGFFNFKSGDLFLAIELDVQQHVQKIAEGVGEQRYVG